MRRADAFALSGLALIPIMLVLLVSPAFEAALDDSWNFALPTMHFLETGRPVFDPFNSAAAVLHILWGGLFCLIFDFSFTACRVSNIVMTLFASWALYFALCQTGAHRKVAFAGAAAFAANPISMVTSFTYQSDVVYLTLAFASTGFYLRYWNTKKHSALLWASLLAGLSIWNKLHGLLLPVGALVFFIISRKDARIHGLRWLTATAIPAFFYATFRLAKPTIHPVSTTLDGKMVEFNERLFSISTWLTEGTWRLFFILLALGIYCLPLFAGWLFRNPEGEDKPKRLFSILLFAGWLVAVKAGLLLFPHGLGFDETYPFHSSVLRELPPMPVGLAHKFLTVFAWPAAALLGYHLTLAVIEAFKKRGALLLLFGLLAPQVLILAPIKLFMDRYFLVLFPLVFVILALRFAKTRFYLPVTLILLFPLFLLGAARVDQYRASNFAQWQGAKYLMNQGVPSLEIDAGYAWTGWHNYEHSLAHPEVDYSRPGDHWYITELCKSTDVKYLVTFWPPTEGTPVIHTLDYDYWFAAGRDKVFIYRRPEIEQ